ncbi:hypothetical protein NADFUDRAFT_48162 [Nadsonia fulvescens var. elongata DSM 6958]|uniref:Brl1/Brr6 domain-containing protein n=1 Tax=Nadsonia fulvescens var. elongata DSM 6958 TaxID=857566 RepID=A0A1E3PCX6_9ASCO|nr:hypothetical protein NADFUDRAFT_48162 [Nadsonia fulvescens var. elongata DSM 6958]
MASIGTFFTNIGNGPKVLFSPTKSVVSFKPHHSPSKISRGRDNHEVVSMKEGKASRRARRLRKTHKTNSDYDSSSLPFTPQGKDQIPEGVCDENCDWEDDKNFRSDQECDVHNSSISILSFSQLPASSPKRLFSMTPDSKLRRYARSRKTESTQRIDGRREHRLDCQPTQTQKYDLIHTPENLPELKISDGSQDRDHNQHQHKNQYQYQLHGQHWSTSSEFNSHKGYWFTDPFLPYTLSMYFQLLFNVILSCALLYFLYAFFRTVQNDVDQLVEQFSANVIAENAQCLWDFKINNCDKDLPGIKLECLELERCFNRDPAIIGRAKLSAGAFAEIIDSFIKPISYKSISVIFILTVGSFGVTNFGFNSFRRVNKMNSNESTQG